MLGRRWLREPWLEHKVIPIAFINNRLSLAMVNPNNIVALDDIRRIIKGVMIEPVIVTEDDLRRLGAGCELVKAELREIGGDPFNMTVAGLRLAHAANAVAQLHGETARAMWAHVEDAAPIIATAMVLAGLAFFVFAAYRIRRESPGPVIFKQRRAGKHGPSSA